jgi:hypothetical protein
VSQLSTRNPIVPSILAHILKLKAQFLDNLIKTLRVEIGGEFTSKAFDDLYIAAGIDIYYPIPYIHFQIKIAKSVIKRLQMVASLQIMLLQLPTLALGHAILHATSLLKYRPSAFNQ